MKAVFMKVHIQFFADKTAQVGPNGCFLHLGDCFKTVMIKSHENGAYYVRTLRKRLNKSCSFSLKFESTRTTYF